MSCCRDERALLGTVESRLSAKLRNLRDERPEIKIVSLFNSI